MQREIKKRDDILFAISFAVEWYLRFQKENQRMLAGSPGPSRVVSGKFSSRLALRSMQIW